MKALYTAGKRRATYTAWLFAAILFASNFTPVRSEEPAKIAVVPFTYSKNTTTGVDVGREMAHLLASRLTASGNYTATLADSALPTNRYNPFAQATTSDQAIEIGRHLGVDAVLIGTVQQFDLVITPMSAARYSPAMAIPALGSYGSAVSGLLGALSSMSATMAANRGKVKAVVETKLIDVASGDTILTLGSAGESRHTGTTLWDHKVNFADFTSLGFSSTVAGEAANATIDPIVTQFSAAAPRLTSLAASYKIRGAITDIDDDLVCINIGRACGFVPGDQLSVDRLVSPVMPGQQPHIGKGITSSVGVLVLTGVGENTAIGTISANIASCAPQIGDYIRGSSGATVTTAGQPSSSISYSQGTTTSDTSASHVTNSASTGINPNVPVTAVTDSGDISQAGGSPSAHRHSRQRPCPPQSDAAWRNFYEGGINSYKSGNYVAARSMFMSTLKFDPPANVIEEIAGYIKSIDDKSHQ